MVTNPPALRTFALLGIVWTLQSCTGFEAGSGQTSPEGYERVQRELHPAGPTTIREWRRKAGEQPYKIAFERVRSGHLLVGATRLQRLPDGGWVVMPPNNAEILLLRSNQNATDSSVSFLDGQQTWQVRVTSQDIPVHEPGIATEGEPSLNLVIETSR